MWIMQVELRNVKSYADSSSIRFERGVNAITGPNGAGKSTILEAIGFALFDALPNFKQGQFLREGEKRGEIVISFVDALDDREYQVVRPVGGGNPCIYDPEVKRKVVEGKADVVDWIKDHLRVEPTADLRSLFNDAVGVPQGMLSAPFLGNKAARKAKFDSLLQVNDYEQAWANLRETNRYLDELINDKRVHIALLHGRLERLPYLEADLERIEAEIDSHKKTLSRAESRIKEVSGQKTTLDVKKTRIDELNAKLRELERDLAGLGRLLANANAALDESRASQKTIEESKSGYEAFVSAQNRFNELETQRQKRDDLNSRIGKVDRELALSEQKLEQLQGEVKTITRAEKRMTELEPLVKRQTKLEADLETAEQDSRRLEESGQRAAHDKTRLEELKAKLEGVREELKKRISIDTQIGTMDLQRTKFERENAQLAAAVERIEGDRQRLQERLSVLQEAEEANCPVCRRPLEEHHKDELNAHYQEEINEIKKQRDQTRNAYQKTKKSLISVEAELSELKREVETLAQPVRETELLEEINRQDGEVKNWLEQINVLANSPKRVAELETKLSELGDPGREYELLGIQTKKRGHTEERIAEQGQFQKKFLAQKAELLSALQEHTSLDADITNQRKILTTHEKDHQRYMQNQQTAQELPSRQEKVEGLITEEENLRVIQEQNKADLEQVRGEYDQAAHEVVKREYEQLTVEIGALEAGLKLRRDHLDKLTVEINALHQDREALVGAERELGEVKTLAGMLDFFRKTIREAGPYITRTLVQTISAEANRIFGEIIND
ncbi:MAG: AAA family ATPase, partial [Anaerolineales bacterium]